VERESAISINSVGHVDIHAQSMEPLNYVYGHSRVKISAAVLNNSRNRQVCCPFHEMGRCIAHFVKWAIRRLGVCRVNNCKQTCMQLIVVILSV